MILTRLKCRYFNLVKIWLILLILAIIPPKAISSQEWISRDAYVSSGIGDARILIPIFADDATSAGICSLIYNGLVKVDKDLNIVGDLAESWDIEQGGLSIVFHLRKGVKWHDGHPFSSEDVKFTYEVLLKKEIGSPYASSYTDIERIEILDPHTIRFFYRQPFSPMLSKFGMGIIPKHLFQERQDLRSSFLARSPIGTGPYKFLKWESSRFIILEANPDYFEHVPGIKRYVYKIIPDQAVQFLELISEEIDSMDLNPYQFLYRSNTPEFKSRINKYIYLTRSYTYIGYNLNDFFFKDKRVRQALSYAINKKEIIDAVLLGLGESCTGPFLKGTPYYDEKVPDYDYNPEKAKRLLREAGYKDTDGDGILEKNGQKFHIKLITNQGNQERQDIAAIVESQWKKIGIETEVVVIAWSAFLDQFINKNNFQAVILGWTIPIDPDLYTVWHSSSIGTGGLNFISYSNKRVDELIELGRREFDPLTRGEIYRKIHRLIADDAPYTFLFFPYATPAVDKRFHGIESAPAGIGYNFIDWYVPKDEVKYKL